MSSAGLRPPAWQVHRNGSTAELELSGDWIAVQTGVRSAAQVRQVLSEAGGLRLRIDARQLGRWDSALIAFLKMLRDGAPSEPDESDLPDTARRLLALAVAGEGAAQPVSAGYISVLTKTGVSFLGGWSETVAAADLVGETMLRSSAAIAGRAQLRAIDVWQLMREAGAGALGIVAIVNALVGAILAFVGAVQLQRFGAGIYIANLVGIAVAREMAAMVTAIVMAGRTGGAYAAHLATMQGNEEIDALNVLGIPIFDFLILPRIAALVTMMPLLYIYGCAVGLFGGFIVSMATLDLTPAAFFEQLRGAVAGTQFELGLIKSIVFGVLVALTGCRIGLKAGRSAADVGRAATSAVVVSIVGIIAADAVFAVCANALGI